MYHAPFPSSSEPDSRHQSRAIAQLQYEERAGLGFRRQEELEREVTPYETVTAYLAAFGTIFGGAAFVFRPALMAFAGTLLCVAGLLGGRSSERIAKIGLIICAVGFVVGAIVCTIWDRKLF